MKQQKSVKELKEKLAKELGLLENEINIIDEEIRIYKLFFNDLVNDRMICYIIAKEHHINLDED